MDLSINKYFKKTTVEKYDHSNLQELSIEEILGNDDILNDLKNPSFSLVNINSLITPLIMRKIISFVIQEYSDEDLYKKVTEMNNIDPEFRNELLFENLKNIYGKKFPYNASEILSCENPKITEMFLYTQFSSKDEDHFEDFDDYSDKNTEEYQQKPKSKDDKPEIKEKFEILEYLLSFLNTDQELNIVLCGYFLKIFNKLASNDQVCIFKLFKVDEIHL